MDPIIINAFKVLVPSAITFVVGILGTPLLTHYLYKYKAWKKQSVQMTLDGRPATISQKLHNDEVKKTPRMGGIVIWGSVLLTISIIWIIARIFPSEVMTKLEFLSRNQTWLPLFTLVAASPIGLIDDIFVVFNRGGYIGKGLPLTIRIATVIIIGLAAGWWFFFKLGVSGIAVPFVGELELGAIFIPF